MWQRGSGNKISRAKLAGSWGKLGRMSQEFNRACTGAATVLRHCEGRRPEAIQKPLIPRLSGAVAISGLEYRTRRRMGCQTRETFPQPPEIANRCIWWKRRFILNPVSKTPLTPALSREGRGSPGVPVEKAFPSPRPSARGYGSKKRQARQGELAGEGTGVRGPSPAIQPALVSALLAGEGARLLAIFAGAG